MNREDWLAQAIVSLRSGLFLEAGYQVPDAVRASCGFPSQKGTARKNRRIGECWPPEASQDAVAEIWISPVLASAAEVLPVLIHEVVHATVGCVHGHKGPFRKCMTAVGLEGKPTSTHAGERAIAWGAEFERLNGAYPAGPLTVHGPKQKQSTRLVKCECPDCGYIARTTRKWIDEVGTPHCPVHGEMGECE